MPGRVAAGRDPLHRHMGSEPVQQLLIACAKGAALGDETIELAQLAEAEGGVDVGEPVIVSGLVHFVIPGSRNTVLEPHPFVQEPFGLPDEPVIPGLPQGLRKPVAVGCQHPAFARRNGLHRMG